MLNWEFESFLLYELAHCRMQGLYWFLTEEAVSKMDLSLFIFHFILKTDLKWCPLHFHPSVCGLIEEERKQLHRKGPVPESLVGSPQGWRIEPRKPAEWHGVHAADPHPPPPVLQFKADPEPFLWVISAVQFQEETFMSLLNFFADLPCLERPPCPCLSHLPFWERSAFNSKVLGMRGPDQPLPGEQWRTGLGTCLSGQKTPVASVVHGTDNQGRFYTQDSSPLVSV